MIREHLTAAIRESFPSLPFSFLQSSNLIATLESPFAEIGKLEVYDDGEEATVCITEVTHGHFNPYDSSLTEQQRDQKIVEEVIDFLQALFAGKVLLERTPSRHIGAWRRLDLLPKPPVLNPEREYFLWSGPYDTHKAA
jgi:hypothetical protein